MKQKVTAAVVIINSRGDILGCHATGRPDKSGWDFPKGLVEAGETHAEGALRELREETGIELTADVLLDAGRHPHNKEKDIHLFLYKTEEMPDPETLRCSTYFNVCDRQTGEVLRTCPECNGYEIIPKSERWKFNKVLANKFDIIDAFNSLPEITHLRPFDLAEEMGELTEVRRSGDTE